MSGKGIETVEGGACIKGKELLQCALEKGQCPPGTTFIPAKDLKDEFSTHGCNKETEILPIGQCLLDEDGGICTSRSENCVGCQDGSPQSCFEVASNDCTILKKKRNIKDYEFSVFGLCESVSDSSEECFWSQDECLGSKLSPATATWIPPVTAFSIHNEKQSDPCTCDKVKLGACKNNNTSELTCAVSEDACDAKTDIYIGARELRGIPNFPDCRLCNEPASTPPPASISSEITSIPCSSVPDDGCSVCGPGLCVTDYDSVFSSLREPISCRDLEADGYSGVISTDECPLLPKQLLDICKCSSNIPINDLSSTRFPSVKSQQMNLSSLTIGIFVGGFILSAFTILGVLGYTNKIFKRNVAVRDAKTAEMLDAGVLDAVDCPRIEM